MAERARLRGGASYLLPGPTADDTGSIGRSGVGATDALALRAGIGLRTEHEAVIADATACASTSDNRPAIPWVEIHGENYLSAGGPRIATLRAISEQIPVSCHCVGLSPGSAEGPDREHLDRLVALFAWLKPALVSDHLSWSVADDVYLNDLLPLPYTEEALDVVCRNVDRIQEAFDRRILIENPSSYMVFAQSSIPECDFIGEVARRTGCGILLDLNNIVVSAANTGLDARAYIRNVPSGSIEEMHLAGHSRTQIGGKNILIDDHGSCVPDAVWSLYAEAVALHGPRPTLVEWDTDLPDLSILCGEAAKADTILQGRADAA